MPNLVSELKVNEVSLVPKGANKKKFVLVKSEKGDTNMEDLLNAVSGAKLENEEKIDQLCNQAKLSSNGMAAVKGAMRLLAAVRDEIPGNLMSMMSALLGGEEQVEASSKDKVTKISTLFDLLLQKINEKSEEVSKVAKSLEFTDSQIEKVINGHFAEVPEDKFVSLFKGLGLKTETVLECVFKELNTPPEPDKKKEEQVAKRDDKSNEEFAKKYNDLQETIRKELKDRDETIGSLKEEIKKLKESPIAAAGEGANGNENIEKSDQDKNFWAGVL